MEFYLAVKSNGLLIDSTTGMNLKDIMLKEENQSQQVTNCMIQLHDVPKKNETVVSDGEQAIGRQGFWVRESMAT